LVLPLSIPGIILSISGGNIPFLREFSGNVFRKFGIRGTLFGTLLGTLVPNEVMKTLRRKKEHIYNIILKRELGNPATHEACSLKRRSCSA
jgi:hypothetical protein